MPWVRVLCILALALGLMAVGGGEASAQDKPQCRTPAQEKRIVELEKALPHLRERATVTGNAIDTDRARFRYLETNPDHKAQVQADKIMDNDYKQWEAARKARDAAEDELKALKAIPPCAPPEPVKPPAPPPPCLSADEGLELTRLHGLEAYLEAELKTATPAAKAGLRRDLAEVQERIETLKSLPPCPVRTSAIPKPMIDGYARCERAAAVLAEINAARTNPAAYAAAWRGVDRVSRDFLEHQPKLAALAASPELTRAAARHAADQGPGGLTGHTGTDGSRPMQRIHEAGLFSTITAEVISVSEASAAGVVHQLIVDAGDPNHPHRADLFNPTLTLAGIGCAQDRRYGTITVIDLSNPAMAR